MRLVYLTELKVRVLSDHPLAVMQDVLDRIVSGKDSGDFVVETLPLGERLLEGAEAVHAALDDMGSREDFFDDEDDATEDDDPGGASLGEDDEDADPAELDDHGGAGVNEDAEDEPDSEEGHLDDPKYVARLGGKTVRGDDRCEECMSNVELMDLYALAKGEHNEGSVAIFFDAGTAYECAGCHRDFEQPQMMPNPEPTTSLDFRVPPDLSEKGAEAVSIILEVLAEEGITSAAGCKTFYSPAEWAAKGEDYANNALLVVVYDGGRVGEFFEYAKENYKAVERMDAALRAADVYPEPGTHVYAGIYPLSKLNK